MRVKSFCGCFSLRTGVLFVGWCTVIWAILSVIYLGLKFNSIYISMNDPYGIAQIIAAGMMTCVIVIGFTGGLMIYGVQKEHHGYIFPWIARTTADFMVVSAFIFGFIVFGAASFPLGVYFISMAILLTMLALHGYIWLVIYSYYMHIIAEKYGCAGSCTEVKKVPSQPLNIYHHI